MSHSGRLQALASLLAMGSLAACTSTPTDGSAPEQPSESARPSAATDPSGDATDPPVLECQDPDASFVAMAKTAIAPHPGPVLAATLVRAAKTRTGTWYVVGIDREYATDGTLTDKPFATSWDRVSWTGSRLAAGQRALRKVVGCLDATGDKS